MNKRTKQKNNDTKYDAKEEEKKIDKLFKKLKKRTTVKVLKSY